MKITNIDINIEFTDNHCNGIIEMEGGYNLQSMASHLVDCVAHEYDVADRIRDDEPELIAEVKDAMRQLRKLRNDMRELLCPLLRKVEKATAKAERALDAEDAAAE